MDTIAALDIETTGLDPKKDAIIEIGICRFKGSRIENEWSSLINPHVHIPEFITNLTGISNEMVRNAPSIQDVLPEVSDFVGRLPILGQNIRFDLSFFERYKILQDNYSLDTFDLASVLLPVASRYNLGALASFFNIPNPTSHRGLEDARTTQRIFIKLLELAGSLPLDILSEIVNLGEPFDWGGNWTFQHELKKRLQTSAGNSPRKKSTLDYFVISDRFHPEKPLDEDSEVVPLDTNEVVATLDYGGPFTKFFSQYEHRPEQVEMLKAVSDSISTGQHLMVEAGTGVGKSLAYLIPAATFSKKNNKKVVISTNTINLQEQLIKKDIPDLNQALDLGIRASILKGRSNYLCPRRVDLLRKHGPQTLDELRVLSKVLVWLQDNRSGDRSDINLTGPAERDAWNRISAENDQCTTETCLEKADGRCPFFQAKQAALNSHLLIVNHALLLTDIATGNRVLPNYDYLIVDEGHHLESATTEALSFRLSEGDCGRLTREIGSSSSGVLSYLLTIVKGKVPPSDFAHISQLVKKASEFAFRTENQLQGFFKILAEFISNNRDDQGNSNYAYQMRITSSVRTLPGWDDIELIWETARETVQNLSTVMTEIQKISVDLSNSDVDDTEDLVNNFGNINRQLSELEKNVSSLVNQPDPNVVYWVEIKPSGNYLTLNMSPIQVGSLLEKYLWHTKSSIVVTSATLTANGDFHYLRSVLGADEADELSLGSPFDYENAALLFIANDIGEPHTNEYQHQLNKAIINLCIATEGRALILFTSYAQLKRTSKAISGPLQRNDIFIFEQGEGSSPNMLLENFKSTEKAVLLGTRSFWEGVDIPGATLSVLVITKLPFDVPTDPIIASRAENYDDPFNEYHLPEAILKFRQGFGRLIRTQSDRGVVVVLDRRVLSKSYGKAFIDSLPPCTNRIGPLDELPRVAAKWLQK